MGSGSRPTSWCWPGTAAAAVPQGPGPARGGAGAASDRGRPPGADQPSWSGGILVRGWLPARGRHRHPRVWFIPCGVPRRIRSDKGPTVVTSVVREGIGQAASGPLASCQAHPGKAPARAAPPRSAARSWMARSPAPGARPIPPSQAGGLPAPSARPQPRAVAHKKPGGPHPSPRHKPPRASGTETSCTNIS